MAPPTDMELTTTDTLERDPRQPNTASQDPVEVLSLLSHLTLDDEGSANDSAKDTTAGKPAMKMSSATNTTSDPPTLTALRPTEKQCLFHADGSAFRMANIVLSMAPINSTGDIYHILAYLFLTVCCTHRAILTYDSADTTPKKCEAVPRIYSMLRADRRTPQIESPDHA